MNKSKIKIKKKKIFCFFVRLDFHGQLSDFSFFVHVCERDKKCFRKLIVVQNNTNKQKKQKTHKQTSKTASIRTLPNFKVVNAVKQPDKKTHQQGLQPWKHHSNHHFPWHFFVGTSHFLDLWECQDHPGPTLPVWHHCQSHHRNRRNHHCHCLHQVPLHYHSNQGQGWYEGHPARKKGWEKEEKIL